MVRHGQSVWNAQGRWQGQADPPLSDLGRSQADAAGAHLTTWTPFDGIATSTLDRAASTGDEIARYLNFDEPYRTSNLAERSAGEWSGLTRDEIEAQYPGYLRARRYPPGYEHDDELLERIHKGLREVVENIPGERLLVVAHGGIVYCIERSLGEPFRHLQNLGAVWLTVDGDARIDLGARVDLLVDFEGPHTTPHQI